MGDAPLNSQNVIAMIWDFDRTLTPGNMQEPLFAEYGIDAAQFWDACNELIPRYRDLGLILTPETAYLLHLLREANGGGLNGLTNEMLRRFGSQIPLAPGMPDFLDAATALVRDDPRYARHGLRVEHFVVSTGLRQMILGSPVAEQLTDVWACELLPELDDGPEGPVRHIGWTVDNTVKTRAIFEINKGVTHDRGIDVNARMSHDDRRVPLAHMIYVADGPSDVPVFSLIRQGGGYCLGVYCLGDQDNYEGLYQLEQEGRVTHIAEADYREGSAAARWLLASVRRIADGICDRRQRAVEAITPPRGHHAQEQLTA